MSVAGLRLLRRLPGLIIAWLGSAGIGHENIGIRTDRQDFGTALGCRNVGGNRCHLDARLGANRCSSSLKCLLTSREHHQLDALTRELLSTAQTQALA